MKSYTQKKHKKMVFGVILGIICSFVLYSFAIASTTFAVSDMESKNTHIADLKTEIAELEIIYFNMINEISTQSSEKYGFTKVNSVGYVSLDKDTRVAYNI